MILMLYEKNLNSEVTRVIEMNKVKNTPQEHFDIEGKMMNGTNIVDKGRSESLHFRVNGDIHTLLEALWGLDVNNVDKSNDLNHITYTTLNVHQLEGNKAIHIFVDTNKNKTYVIEKTKNKSEVNHVGFIIPAYEDTDKYLRNVLRLQLDNEVPSSQTSNALRKLWLYQIQNDLPNQVSQTEKDNPHMLELINYLTDYMQSDDRLAEAHITYRELFDFFDEVKAQHITEKTQNVQNWVAYSKSDYVVQSYEMHERAEQLNQQFTFASAEDVKYIKHMIRKDKRFKHDIKSIYKVSDPKPQKQGMKRFIGVHGSPNRTILSILLNGLKSSQSLNKEGISHAHTGSGLGSGVYFAQLHQASKSANYTHNKGQKRFLIIADVDYDKTRVKRCSHYGYVNTNNYSLIHGEKVGSRNYDEIVAPHDDQIHIRYLVEIL